MDTKKLAKIIKVIVEHELKKQLPELIEEGVQAELKRRNVEEVKQKPQVVEEVDPFSLATAALEEDRLSNSVNEEVHQPVQEKRHFTKNPVLNEILNNTTPFSKDSSSVLDKTVTMDTNLAQGGLDAMRSQMASKMGYGGISTPTPQATTGVPTLDKALTRDYSELVKRFPTRK